MRNVIAISSDMSISPYLASSNGFTAEIHVGKQKRIIITMPPRGTSIVCDMYVFHDPWYYELSSGMVGFNSAVKIADVPISFPYAQALPFSIASS